MPSRPGEVADTGGEERAAGAGNLAMMIRSQPSQCRSGETGRRAGLKIPWGSLPVRVRPPPPAPNSLEIFEPSTERNSAWGWTLTIPYSCPVTPRLIRRHACLQLLEPIEDHVYLGCGRHARRYLADVSDSQNSAVAHHVVPSWQLRSDHHQSSSWHRLGISDREQSVSQWGELHRSGWRRA
jgi:hypothetical protein